MGGGPGRNENPRHRVWVAAFTMARHPVTRAWYATFLDATGHPAPPCWSDPAFGHPRMPAVGVSWFDAAAFCSWASAHLGFAVRLPTEAEWERAARGGRGDVLYPWGDAPPEALPDYAARWSVGPEPVDLYPSRHPWGLLGLGENVHEWCADWYAADYYRVSPDRDPQGPATGGKRASRGGAWRHAVKGSRCAARSAIPPGSRYADYGVRLVTSALEL
jgi:formylglycine-generating enzyme required for sulfatase activity